MIDKIYLETELIKWQRKIKIHPYDARIYIHRGMTFFKLGKIVESIQDFNKAEELNPQITPYLWQRGLSYYYAEKYLEGARQFEIDLSVNSQDLEETIWHYLCINHLDNIPETDKKLLPVKQDSRLIMRQIYRFYTGNCSLDNLMFVGQNEGRKGLFYANLYLGLYYEIKREKELSLSYIKKAIQYKLNDYMWYLACVHFDLRNTN